MGLNSEKRLDAKFRKRLRRRLHYGDMADLDAPSLPLTELAVDYFHDSSPGKLGYVDLEAASNIVRENKVTPCSMVVSVLYAKRLRQRNKQYLDSMSSSDVFFISMMMASKYIYDEGTDDEVYNDEWAVSVDQDVCDVNKMEMDFLQAMDWRLFVHPNEFEQTLAAIEKRLALQEGLKRGWFTYAELDVLMGPDLIGSLWSGVGSEFSKLLVSLSAAYVTGLLSMLGSVALATQVSGPLSSATVAFMALHSSSSPMVSLGGGLNFLPAPNLCGDADSPSDCQSLVSVEDGEQVVDLDLHGPNTSTEEPVFTVQHQELYEPMLDHVTTLNSQVFIGNEGGKEKGVEEFRQEAAGEGEESGQQLSRFGQAITSSQDENKQDSKSSQPTRQITSSLWSLWFLDSLLSQIWSLSSVKSLSSSKKSFVPSKEKGSSANISQRKEALVSAESFDELSPCSSGESLLFPFRNECGTAQGPSDTPCNHCSRSHTVRSQAERERSRKCLSQIHSNIFHGSLVCGLFSGLAGNHGSPNGLLANCQTEPSGDNCKSHQVGLTNPRFCSQELVFESEARISLNTCSCQCEGELSDPVLRHLCTRMETPGSRISNRHRDREGGGGPTYFYSSDEVPTRPLFFNLSTSVFTRVPKLLQMA